MYVALKSLITCFIESLLRGFWDCCQVDNFRVLSQFLDSFFIHHGMFLA